ncbi:MAG: DUF1279 domain-containing protein [Deltaproteobacteria bacterium]|jgi:hypothetical protein|nr:DUF1279 domain-containing protein [Deltaproteobacteria bacterium]
MLDALLRLQARLRTLFRTYGRVALGVWFSVFALTWLGFYLALGAGLDLAAFLRAVAETLHLDAQAWASAGAGTGQVVIAYAAAQVTKPLRIVITLTLTPVVARWLGRAPATPSSTVVAADTSGSAAS